MLSSVWVLHFIFNLLLDHASWVSHRHFKCNRTKEDLRFVLVTRIFSILVDMTDYPVVEDIAVIFDFVISLVFCMQSLRLSRCSHRPTALQTQSHHHPRTSPHRSSLRSLYSPPITFHSCSLNPKPLNTEISMIPPLQCFSMQMLNYAAELK